MDPDATPPTSVTLLPADAVREVPWKNGRGVTREVAISPEGAGFDGFDWRVSAASVVEPGPFSVFEGIERILVVTHGDRLVLSHDGEGSSHELRRLEPYRFSGGRSTSAQLPHGPVRDFNVMFAPSRVEARVEVIVARTRRVLGAGAALLHVVAGRTTARVPSVGETFELARGDSLVARGLRGGEELELGGDARSLEALLVTLAPRDGAA